MDTTHSRPADKTNPPIKNFPLFTLPMQVRFFLWRAGCVSMAALLFAGTTSVAAQPLTSPVNPNGMPSQETMPPPPATGTKKTIAVLKEELTNFQMTDNPDYDYATLLQILQQVDHDLAIAELSQGSDSELRRLASKEKSSSTQAMKKLSQWIERFHKFD